MPPSVLFSSRHARAFRDFRSSLLLPLLPAHASVFVLRPSSRSRIRCSQPHASTKDAFLARPTFSSSSSSSSSPCVPPSMRPVLVRSGCLLPIHHPLSAPLWPANAPWHTEHNTASFCCADDGRRLVYIRTNGQPHVCIYVLTF